MNPARFEILEHPADVGLAAYGSNFAEAFTQAALGLINLLTDPATVRPQQAVGVEVESEDRETLLVKWLNEILFYFDAKSFIPSRFEIEELTERRLRGRMWGEEIDPARHEFRLDVKAVTYHQLQVEETEKGVRVQVFFDI